MERDENLRKSVVDAVRDMEFTDTEAWSLLDTLSGNTQVDALETFQDEIRFEELSFFGPLTWYVTLRYGQEGSSDAVATSETFPGSFEGHMVGGRPIIDRMTVDVSSFHS